MAANTRDIRRRIKSVKNTSQITKAMQMVAASKMRKAQMRALSGRPYAEDLAKILAALGKAGSSDELHPLLQERKEVKRELVIVISTDKGLCGALNTNLLRELNKFDAAKTTFVAVGRKGAQYLGRMKRDLAAEFELKETFTFLECKQASKFAIEKFLSGEVDKVTVAYTDFISTLRQEPTLKVILPVQNFELTDLHGTKTEVAANATEYLFEPSAGGVLEHLVPHYVHFAVYQMVLESRASEHSARMVAMKNATDNAKQLIKDLTLEYNKIRQAGITTELLEITTAQMALG
ncbi:MAG: ATP synthase F1 subunit gamma [Verrucomicrobia bacterium]|nr:ATP synthase F1 subunit gamma [Verrucomicrobiota bacterium]